MRIGFLGLGNMGAGMARNLLRGGHELTVYNRSRGSADELAKAGAKVAEAPAQAAAQEIVISMLADDHAVESVVLGANGAVEGMPRGALHISMSTISPTLSERLAKAHAERGQRYMAAPVFGRPDAAAEGKLFIVAAGPRDCIATARPIFELLGQRTFEIDEHPEHANFIKLFGNFMITCALESMGEVFTVARKAQIDPNAVLEVLTGTLFGAPVYQNYGTRIIEEKFSPAGFAMPLGLKDTRLILQEAEKLAAPMPYASLNRDRFLSAIAAGHSQLDWSAITLMAAQSAGLPPKS